MTKTSAAVLIALAGAGLAPAGESEQPTRRTGALTEDYWVGPMKKLHAGFDGTAGYVAQFGDSITYSMAFWKPFSWSDPEKYLPDDGLPKRPAGRWRDTIKGAGDEGKGPKAGNYSGWRVGQVLKAMDGVIEARKPEVAIIMIGTNDIGGGAVPEGYAGDLDKVITKCLAAKCVPILNTIPPRRGREQAVAECSKLIRQLAHKHSVPLADYHAEIVQRRPGNSWDGVLIGKDGVHPTGGKSHVFTDENLNVCGYALRNWVNFLVYRKVYFNVLEPVTSRPGRDIAANKLSSGDSHGIMK